MILVGLIVSAHGSLASLITDMEKGNMCLGGNYPPLFVSYSTCVLRDLFTSAYNTHTFGYHSYMDSLGWVKAADLFENRCGGLGC